MRPFHILLLIACLYNYVMFAQEEMNNHNQKKTEASSIYKQTYPFKLPELNYAYDALEPYIDKQTMEIHHSKHHAGYVEKLNAVRCWARIQELKDEDQKEQQAAEPEYKRHKSDQ